MKEEKVQESLLDRTKEESERIISEIIEGGINSSNIEILGELIDIHKDIANEEYWKIKEENMRYRGYERDSYGRGREEMYGNYPSYGRGYSRDSRGRFKESGRDMKYRGHEMIDDMYGNYNMYSEGKEMMDRGNYGAKEDTIKSLEYMMDSVVCFVEMLSEDATPEEMQIIKKYSKKISEI